MLKKVIYISHVIGYQKVGRLDKPIYDMPKRYDVIISSINGSTDLAIYGERVFKMLRASLNSYQATNFKEGDLIYFEIEPPYEEREVENEEDGTIEIVKGFTEPYGEGANYKVISVRPQNVKTMVYFEKLP